MSLRPGDRLGPYEVQSLIGAGGMGEVYRAHEPALDLDAPLLTLPSVLVSHSSRAGLRRPPRRPEEVT